MRRWLDEHLIRASEEAWMAVLQLIKHTLRMSLICNEAQRLIALLRRAAEQHTKLPYDYDVLPQQRQRCALPGVRG